MRQKGGNQLQRAATYPADARRNLAPLPEQPCVVPDVTRRR
jgi:hypothetical protein